jgi:hypothetical protein
MHLYARKIINMLFLKKIPKYAKYIVQIMNSLGQPFPKYALVRHDVYIRVPRRHGILSGLKLSLLLVIIWLEEGRALKKP